MNRKFVEKGNVSDSRLRSVAVFAVVLGILILWRMVDITILNHAHYLAEAKGQQEFQKTEMAERGKIYVHDSNVDPNAFYPLAFDVKKFDIWVVPQHVKDKEALSGDLASLTGLSKSDIFSKINNEKLYIPPIQKGLTLDQANKIKAGNLPGVYIMPEYSRYYPEGQLASQVLGFVNSSGEGNYGVEGHYNNELKGKDGNVTGEKDTLGRVINLLNQNNPQDGTNYVLTIDRSVQYFVERKLADALTQYQADSGTVIIMDIKTGGIVAMANLPSYDPNNYKAQATANASVFNNPAIASVYEPGSILKTINMAGAIDKGIVTPDTIGTFGSEVTVQGYQIHTAEDKAFGTENMTQVLENSDNVAMVWLSDQEGNETEYNNLKAFNMLDKTGIDMNTEVTGNVPALKQWRDITRATVAFGQGISVTPLQMLCGYAAIANNGKYLYPHIVDAIQFPDGSEKKVEKHEGAQVVSEKTAKEVQEMLYNVVQNGTGKKAKVPGFKVSAKTGTAQIPDPAGGYLTSPDDSGLGIYNHSAAGFAPSDNPQFAMIVKLEKPKTSRYAESTAVPLFGEISSFLLNYHYRLKPTEPIN